MNLGSKRHRFQHVSSGVQRLWREIASAFDVRFDAPVAVNPSVIDTWVGFEDEMQTLASKIQTFRYAVTLFEGHGLPNASLMRHANRASLGRVTMFGHYDSSCNVHHAYQLLSEDMSEADAEAALRYDAQALGGGVDRIVHRKVWRYFPHVTGKEMRDGFYDRFDAVQGVSGVYCVGGAMNFETLESAAAHAEHTVMRFF